MTKRLGFAAEDTVVTVIGAEAPHSVMYSGDADDPQDAQKLLEVLVIGLANMATNNAVLTGGGAVVVLNPEHAKILADAGLDRPAILQRLNAHALPNRTAVLFLGGLCRAYQGRHVSLL